MFPQSHDFATNCITSYEQVNKSWIINLQFTVCSVGVRLGNFVGNL